MSIRLKLILGFNLFLAALAILGYLAYSHLDRSRDLSAAISSRDIERVEHAGHLDEELTRLRSLELAYILEGDPSLRGDTADQLPPALRAIDARVAQYRQTFKEEPVPPDFLPFQKDYEAYLSVHQRMVSLADQGRGQEALALYSASTGDFQALTDTAHSLRHAGFEDAQAATREVGSFTSRTQYVLIGGLLAVAILIFAIGHPLTAYIGRRLAALLEGTERVSRGEFDRPVGAGGGDEFGALARAFNRMMDSLRVARDEVTGLHSQALAMHQERIALLQERVTQVVKAQEEERRRVARELHDQAGQVLTALQLGLSRLQMTGGTKEVEEQAASLRELALEAMDTVRNLALDLRPSSLDELGLPGALQDYIETFSRRTGIAAKLEISGVPQRLPAEAEITLFRIVQEGLTNTTKHAQANQVTVSLTFDTPLLRLVVEDDGIGFDAERALGPDRYKSLGLLGVQERCHLLGAEFEICSRLHEGTRLAVSVPLGASLPASTEPEMSGLH